MLVIVKTIKDALTIVQNVPDIQYVNIGNVGKSVGGNKTELSSFVLLTDEELENLKRLVELEPKTALQVVPSAEKKLAADLLGQLKK